MNAYGDSEEQPHLSGFVGFREWKEKFQKEEKETPEMNEKKMLSKQTVS